MDISGAAGLPSALYQQLQTATTLIVQNLATPDATRFIAEISIDQSTPDLSFSSTPSTGSVFIATLDLSGGTWGADYAQVFAPLIAMTSMSSGTTRRPSILFALKTLILDNVKLGAAGVCAISRCFVGPTLDLLSLKNVGIGQGLETSAAPWASLLSATCANSIHLHSNGIDAAGALCILSAKDGANQILSASKVVWYERERLDGQYFVLFGMIPFKQYSLLSAMQSLGLSITTLSPQFA